jgi:pimeloyl-ACP methyl ester carboxylesterase
MRSVSSDPAEGPESKRQRRGFIGPFAWAAIGSVAAGFLALWLVGSSLSAPVKIEVGTAPPELMAETVRFPSQFGATLAAWYGEPSSGEPVIVLSHGIRGSRKHLVGRARFLRDAGYGVMLYDARGHGESSGDQITFGYLEAHDAAAAVAYVRARTPGSSVGFIGASLAGASALLGPEPLDVDALVLEAVYPTLETAVTNRIALRLGIGLAPMLSKLLLWQVEPRLGFDPFTLNPIDRIHLTRAPILLIAGSEDRRTSLAESRALYREAPDPKQLWILNGATHESFHRFAGREYERRILEFFAANL